MMQPAPSTTPKERWQVGVCCEADAPLESCLVSLRNSGWMDSVRLFLTPGTVVPKQFGHLPVTCLAPDLSWPARELMMMSEMVMRAPEATAYLLLRGDMTVGRPELRRELENVPGLGEGPSMFLLESQEGLDGQGWNRLGDRPARTPKAIGVTREAAQSFLATTSVLETAVKQSGTKAGLGETLQSWAFDQGLPVHVPDRDFIRCAQEPIADEFHHNDTRLRVYGTELSIIVPTWNCAPFLRRCLRSLLAQTVDAELIVVDDASQDETPEILQEFADRIRTVRHGQRRGANAARNTGLRLATGDFVVMADADNEYSPNWLEKLLDAILSSPDIGLAYCGFSRLFEDGRKWAYPSLPWDIRELWDGNYIDMPSLVRREALPPTGLVEGFRPFDDWRLWLDMATRGWRGKHVQKDLYVKRVRKDSKTLRSKAMPAERARDVAHLRRQYARLVGLDTPIGVVIPAHGCEDLTVECLKHLADFSGVPLEVYYVDNGSALSALDVVVRAAEQEALSLRILRNSENLGFTHAVNQGIEASGEANVLILNNDCFVGPNCIDNLAFEMSTRERVAAIGPLTCDDGAQSLRIREVRFEADVGEDIHEIMADPVATALKLRQRGKTADREVLAFFCTLLNREALRRFGGLDERFPSGLAADDEWCLRARNHGWRTLLSCTAYAAHLHRSTFDRFGIDRETLQQEAKQVLQQALAEEENGLP